MNYSIAALHSHSTASDGMVTPTQLVADAAQAGIKVLALTDHDTLSETSEAKKAGKKLSVEIIVGEEIQTKIQRILKTNHQNQNRCRIFFLNFAIL